MRLFLSYTFRDGIVRPNHLRAYAEQLGGVGDVYVDYLHNRSRVPQENCIDELNCADIIVLCFTPAVGLSPWVKLEMRTASKRRIPVIGFDPTLNAAKSLDSLVEELARDKLRNATTSKCFPARSTLINEAALCEARVANAV